MFPWYTQTARRFYHEISKPIHSLGIVGGGAGLSYLLQALKSAYAHRNLKITIFEPNALGTGHAFATGNPEEFTTNTPASEIDDFMSWLEKSKQQKYAGDDHVPRSLVGHFLQDKLNDLLNNPGTLAISHISSKVVDFHAPTIHGLQNILHLRTQDGAQYAMDAYVIATGQIGTHKQLPGMPPAQVVNSIYPFIDGASPLTRALNPLLKSKEKSQLMIIGSGPSGLETVRYLLNHYESRLHITLVGNLNDIPSKIVFNDNITIIERATFQATPDSEKYKNMDLFINAMGINRDPRGGILESIIPASNLTVLRGNAPMKTKGFNPIVTQSIAGTFCVANAYLYGSAAEGGEARLSNFPGMAEQLANQIESGINLTPKSESSSNFSLLPLDRYVPGYETSNYYLERIQGTPDEQHFKMLKGFTANQLLLALLIPKQVPPAICAKGESLYLLHKRFDTHSLAKTVKDLLNLTDPKLTIPGIRHLFTLNNKGQTVIALENQIISVTQRIRTKRALALVGGLYNLDENQLYMVLFPYHTIKNQLPASLIENKEPPQHIAVPALQGTIGHNLLPLDLIEESPNNLALQQAFRNKEDPSPLALPLALIQRLNQEQSARRMLVRISAHEDMTSYDFINHSLSIFEFFSKEINDTYRASAYQVTQGFYERVDISLRTLTILRIREWVLTWRLPETADYLKQFNQLCKKNSLLLNQSFVALQEEPPLGQQHPDENPYLDRALQTYAFEIFQQLEILRNCDPYRLRLLRNDINALPENKDNKPLYDLIAIINDDSKRFHHIKNTVEKLIPAVNLGERHKATIPLKPK